MLNRSEHKLCEIFLYYIVSHGQTTFVVVDKRTWTTMYEYHFCSGAHTTLDR